MPICTQGSISIRKPAHCLKLSPGIPNTKIQRSSRLPGSRQPSALSLSCMACRRHSPCLQTRFGQHTLHGLLQHLTIHSSILILNIAGFTGLFPSPSPCWTRSSEGAASLAHSDKGAGHSVKGHKTTIGRIAYSGSHGQELDVEGP